MIAASPRLPIAAVLALGAVALTGCQPEGIPAQQAVPQQLTIQKQSASHVLRLGPDGRPAALERERLDAFIADLVRGRPDALHMTVSGARSEAQLLGVAGMLVADGVDPNKITVTPTADAGAGPVTIAVDRYTATAPTCAPWSVVQTSATDNDARRPDAGCSNLANLAAMVADPHDLVQGSTTPYADGTTSATAVQRYHTDSVKALPKIDSGFTIGGGSGGSGTGSGGGQ